MISDGYNEYIFLTRSLFTIFTCNVVVEDRTRVYQAQWRRVVGSSESNYVQEKFTTSSLGYSLNITSPGTYVCTAKIRALKCITQAEKLSHKITVKVIEPSKCERADHALIFLEINEVGGGGVGSLDCTHLCRRLRWRKLHTNLFFVAIPLTCSNE